jgi:Holliday junction resolvase
MINSRAKGHAYELQIVNRLKELGYDAVTSRSESKNMDNLGVDIIDNTDFYIQCKAVEKLKPSLHDILKRMPTEKIPVVFHKRNNKGTIVALSLEHFEQLLLQTRD